MKMRAKKQLRRLVRPFTKGNQSLRMAEDILKQSIEFDARWYLEQYPDVASNKDWRKRPHAHYLRFGAKEGRNPSPLFKTKWYLKQNPDVAQRGVNPLLHYLRFGAAEGRLPAPSTWANAASNGVQAVEFWAERLWGGYSEQALVELQKQSDRADVVTQRYARWYLARWEYAHGNMDTALAWLGLVDIAEAKFQISMQAIIGRARCYIQQGDMNGLQQQISRVQQGINAELNPILRSQLPFLYLSDISKRASQRLEPLNDLYHRAGLQTVMAQSDDLSLSSLTSTTNASNAVDGPLVSVIIPAFNAESTLPTALQSLRAQSWHNLEIIVVDDCSDDKTADIAMSLAAQDKRIRLLKNEHNLGAYPSRNRGVQASKGDFITVHDSDDWSHPDKIRCHVEALLECPSAQLSVSQWVRTLADLRLVGSWFLNHEFLEKNHSSAMFRRAVIDKVGYWDPVNVAGDTEYLWRVQKAFGADAMVEIFNGLPLSFALEHENSLTRHSSSHVKTIHYGLRRLYREAAKSWHSRTALDDLYMPANASRCFAAPWGNVRGQKGHFDVVVVGNFSAKNTRMPTILAALERECFCQGRKRLAFVHYPSMTRDMSTPVADAAFVFAQHYDIPFLHSGVVVSAADVIVVNSKLLEFELDAAPQIQGVERVMELERDGLFKTIEMPQALLAKEH